MMFGLINKKTKTKSKKLNEGNIHLFLFLCNHLKLCRRKKKLISNNHTNIHYSIFFKIFPFIYSLNPLAAS